MQILNVKNNKKIGKDRFDDDILSLPIFVIK